MRYYSHFTEKETEAESHPQVAQKSQASGWGTWAAKRDTLFQNSLFPAPSKPCAEVFTAALSVILLRLESKQDVPQQVNGSANRGTGSPGHITQH